MVIPNRRFGTTYPEKKTGAQNIIKEVKQCQKNWLQHVQRLDTNRIRKLALQYRPKDEGT
jgi:hypothetical protein